MTFARRCILEPRTDESIGPIRYPCDRHRGWTFAAERTHGVYRASVTPSAAVQRRAPHILSWIKYPGKENCHDRRVVATSRDILAIRQKKLHAPNPEYANLASVLHGEAFYNP